MSEQLVPMGDRLVVVADEIKDTTDGGLVIAPSAQDKPTTGTVEAVGDEVTRVEPEDRERPYALWPTRYRVGDRVVYAAWSGTEYLAGGRTWLILRESEIVGKLVTA